MISYRRALPSVVGVLLVCCLELAGAQINPDWTAPQKPFRIAGKLYYVGSRDLAAYLIVTSAGNILINSNLETSPPQIRASVEALGFRWADTRILLNSQAHFDHAAGSAEILRETGAKMMVMDGDAQVMETGGAHDFGGKVIPPFPPAHVSRVLRDGYIVQLGRTVLTAHKTAGHTRGCTTWTMQVEESGRELNVVIVGGFAALDTYRLLATPTRAASYPSIKQDFEHGYALLRTLPCDIFLGAHGAYFGMQEKLAKIQATGSAIWIDPKGYLDAIDNAERNLQKHLDEERKQDQSANGLHLRGPHPRG